MPVPSKNLALAFFDNPKIRNPYRLLAVRRTVCRSLPPISVKLLSRYQYDLHNRQDRHRELSSPDRFAFR